MWTRVRHFLTASRAHHVRSPSKPTTCENSQSDFHRSSSTYKLCSSPKECTSPISVAGLLEQISYIGGMVQLQRHVHMAASLHAQVIQQNLPVSVDEVKIRNVLKANNVAFELGYTCFIMDCIFCKHKKAGRKSDGEKMYVNIITGSFVCHQCGRSGSWAQLEDHLSLRRPGAGRKAARLPPAAAEEPTPPPAAVTRLWEAAQPAESLEQDALQPVLERLGLRGISADTLRRFEARLTADGGLAVPLRRPDGSLAGLRLLAAAGTERTLPPGLPLPAGAGTVRGRDYAVLTARLVDALAISEKARQPVLALPNGSSSLPPELLPHLERFQRLTLWFPDDVVSWYAVRVFARKLAERRCFTVRPSSEHGPPLQALQAGVSLTRALEAAAPLYHNAITTFSALRQHVFEEISNANQVAGVQWKRFPALNRLLRGHRRGELTVVSGPTGAGKTTFISEYSLDLCMQGVNTLWGSFEINNTRLAKVMLHQLANCALDKHIDRFDQAADEFEKLPMWFMTFHGQQSIPHVLDAMSHAAYVHDIGHVVLDNLQFMMGAGERGMDRFFEQDAVISRFRRFATMKNCHVTLVIHPRKERSDEELGLASVFGGARATQEADNVLIMQVLRTGDTQRKYIQVLKNRFSGDLGPMPLHFNKDSLSFVVKRKKRVSESDPQAKDLPESRGSDSTVKQRVKSAAATQPRQTAAAPEPPSEDPVPE
ncbi:twinkle protein, mitochondrial-like [Amphibalanus amphitrite]|uniref:twinkle protein, mitochondrial-like n=1 Tax=Amphibalanus amphitrite TaxID=1232801 RepID=UPI001C918000|nr:twinkle protein, mitochondrial-like [Amphibalanus amphitrite]